MFSFLVPSPLLFPKAFQGNLCPDNGHLDIDHINGGLHMIQACRPAPNDC